MYITFENNTKIKKEIVFIIAFVQVYRLYNKKKVIIHIKDNRCFVSSAFVIITSYISFYI